MPRDEDDREVAVLQTEVADVQVEVVVDELQRAGEPVRIQPVEEEAMLAGHLAVPVVLRVARGFEPASLGRLRLGRQTGSANGGAPDQAEAKPREERTPCEHAG